MRRTRLAEKDVGGQRDLPGETRRRCGTLDRLALLNSGAGEVTSINAKDFSHQVILRNTLEADLQRLPGTRSSVRNRSLASKFFSRKLKHLATSHKGPKVARNRSAQVSVNSISLRLLPRKLIRRGSSEGYFT